MKDPRARRGQRAAEPNQRPRELDPGKIERSKSGIPIVHTIDGFRAVAVLSILVFHLISPTGLRATLPDTAAVEVLVEAMPRMIDVLFIISGFVLFMPTAHRGGQFGNVAGYAISRAARILPTYYVAVGLVVALLVFYAPIDAPTPTLWEVGVHLAILQSPATVFDPGFPIGLGLDGALWTISTLVTFYILLPFIAGPFYRRPLLMLGIAAAISFGWRLFADDLLVNAYSVLPQLPYWALQLALGMTAARYWETWTLGPRAPLLASRWAPRAQILALFGLVTVLWAGDQVLVPGDLVVALTQADQTILIALVYPALMALLIFSTALGPKRRRLGLDGRKMGLLGESSYGIYMVHLPIIILLVVWEFLPRNGSTEAALLWTAAVIVPSVLFGWLTYRYIELPVRLWAHAWSRRFKREQTGGTPGAQPLPADPHR